MLFQTIFQRIILSFEAKIEFYNIFQLEFLQAQALSSYSKQPVLEFPAVLPSTQLTKSWYQS